MGVAFCISGNSTTRLIPFKTCQILADDLDESTKFALFSPLID